MERVLVSSGPSIACLENTLAHRLEEAGTGAQYCSVNVELVISTLDGEVREVARFEQLEASFRREAGHFLLAQGAEMKGRQDVNTELISSLAKDVKGGDS
jgi:hypothetical protein